MNGQMNASFTAQTFKSLLDTKTVWECSDEQLYWTSTPAKYKTPRMNDLSGCVASVRQLVERYHTWLDAMICRRARRPYSHPSSRPTLQQEGAA